MAIAISEPTPAVITTTDGTSFATAAYTPSANSIQVFIVFAKGAPVPTPTLTDTEGAWTRKYVATPWPEGASHGAFMFYRKVGASPVSITPTFDCTGDDFSSCAIVTFEVIPDTVVTGDPIRQVAFGTDVSASVVEPNVTFASALVTTNGYVAAVCNATNSTNQFTEPSGWTETRELGVGTNNTGAAGYFRAGGETGTTYSITGATSSWAMLAVEILNDEPPAGGVGGSLVGRRSLLRGLL